MTLDIKSIENKDGSHTITYGVWILARVFLDKRVKKINYSEAPAHMQRAADKEIARLTS